jgi:hypothetical protein
MSFVDTINSAQNENIIDPMVPMDNISAVLGTQGSPVKGKKKPMGQSINCTGHSKVFVLWRPWTHCARCVRAIEHDEVTLPDEGDHSCPHVQTEDFEDVLNKCLSGDYLIQTQEYFTLQEGTRCVHMVWLALNAEGHKAAQKKETAKIFTPIHSDLVEEREAEAAAAALEHEYVPKMEEYDEPPTQDQKETPEESDV